MNWRSFLFKLEKILKEKYPHMEISFYVSRRKRYVHMGFEKALLFFLEHQKIIAEIENLWCQNRTPEFEFVNPPRLVKTVKWNFDYILFRKTYDTV